MNVTSAGVPPGEVASNIIHSGPDLQPSSIGGPPVVTTSPE